MLSTEAWVKTFYEDIKRIGYRPAETEAFFVQRGLRDRRPMEWTRVVHDGIDRQFHDLEEVQAFGDAVGMPHVVHAVKSPRAACETLLETQVEFRPWTMVILNSLGIPGVSVSGWALLFSHVADAVHFRLLHTE